MTLCRLANLSRSFLWAGILLLTSATAHAQQEAPAKQVMKVQQQPDKAIFSAYCTNVGDAAEEARAGIRQKYLEELEGKIEERIAALDAKRMSIEKWMKRREEFLASATKNLVDIYTAMRPEAAAQQISIMEDETAAAILLRLKPRTASAILNEIKPVRAAWLASVIAGATRRAKPDDKS